MAGQLSFVEGDPVICGLRLVYRRHKIPLPPPRRPDPTKVPREMTVLCTRCMTRYEMLPGCRLLDKEEQLKREEENDQRWFILNPDTECRTCSFGHRCSGWCIFTDTYDEDELEENPRLKEYVNNSLKEYYEGIRLGEEIYKHLREMKK